MPGRRKMAPPLSPAEIAVYTGMDAPGLIAGASQRAEEKAPTGLFSDSAMRAAVTRRQSGGEGLGDLPNAGPADPHDGP